MGPGLVARLDDSLIRPDQVARPFEIRWIGHGQFLEDRDGFAVARDCLGASPGEGEDIAQIVKDAGIVRLVGAEASFHGFGQLACQCDGRVIFRAFGQLRDPFGRVRHIHRDC